MLHYLEQFHFKNQKLTKKFSPAASWAATDNSLACMRLLTLFLIILAHTKLSSFPLKTCLLGGKMDKYGQMVC